MPLAAGTRLGPYEILAPAGAGGMGEVYRARDTRLGREVAIKVLPAQVASDPELRLRLEREARAVSSLSHPHICALYDVGQQEGLDFLVMEYLEGDTLASRLARGPLPPDQVVRYGSEIAAALHAAHRKGIVHRDLKPGNVMLTRTGTRLLDFGLAKPRVSPPSEAAAPTVAGPLTAEGTLVGTFHYMPPEQLEGREADARSDIFALGAVLYEMATGRRAFDGRTTASVIAAVLEREPPPISTLQPLVPHALDHIVRGCLAKDPEERWQTAHDVRLQLEALRDRTPDVTSPASSAMRLREKLAWALAALATLVALLVGGAALRRGAEPVAPRVRASVLAPAAHSFVPHEFAVSPDGRRIAYVAAGPEGASTLWVAAMDSAQPAAISGTEGAGWPFWSPDSRWIAFYAQGRLMKVEPGGSGLQVICEVGPFSRAGAWGARNQIVLHAGVLGPLLRVDANGGTPSPVTAVPAEMPGEAHRFPQFLADGRRFLYVATWSNAQRGGLYLGDLDGGAPKLVSGEIRSRVVLAGEHLFFIRGGTLYARPFDDARGELAGTARAVVRNEIASDWRFGDTPVSVSATGLLLFQSRLSYSTQLVWFDRNGREQGTLGALGLAAPELSPDGRYVAATLDSTGSGQENIWIYDLQRGVSMQLTSDGTDTAVSWSPDGRWLAYSSMRGLDGIYRRPADGSGTEERLKESAAHLLVNDWSPDGRWVAYMDFSTGVPLLRRLDVTAGQDELIPGGAAEASFSPDGRWLASITQSGTLHAAALDHPGGRLQISSGLGSQPRWRADGKEIFYVARNRQIVAVSVAERDGRLELGNPQPLFQTRIVQPNYVLFQYDVSADGGRFLVNSLPREERSAPLTLLTDWQKELQR